MADVLRLVRVDFDDLENRNPIFQEVVGVFVGDEGGMTASAKADEWFKNNGPFVLYRGYDGCIYPKFRLEKDKIL